MTEQLRAAVIGVGRIGSLHSSIYANDPRTKLVGVMDASADRANQVASQLGTNAYSDADDLLASEELDIVSIATPESFRLDMTRKCIAAGAHLLLEKPLAPTLDEARELVRIVKESGLKSTVNFILRSDPRYVHAKQGVVNGNVGELCTLFGRRRGTAAGAAMLGEWTDLLISTAIHDLDAMIWMADSKVERVHAEGVMKQCAKWGHHDAVLAVLRFRNGVIGSLETSWVLPSTVPAPLDASLQVVGTGGGVFIDGSNHGLSVVDEQSYRLPDMTHWPTGQTGVFGDLKFSVDRFLRHVIDGEDPPMQLDDALYAEEIVAAVKKSMELGAPVHLD
jgi:predicted dehydrogenase